MGPLSYESRLALARIVTTFICAAAVTVLWIKYEDLAGPFTFLVLTFRELAFPPGPCIGTHVEATIVNSIAIWIAIVYCCVGKVFAAIAVRRYGSPPMARAIPALFLAVMAFTSGFLRGKWLRLTVPSRMANITAVFLLTSDIGASQVPGRSWFAFVIVSAIASSSSLLATLLFLRHSTKSYPHLVVNALGELREHIVRSIDQAFHDKHATSDTNEKGKRPLQLPEATPKLIPAAQLHVAFAQSFLEMHYKFLHVKEIRPFTHIIDRLRTELSWGSTIPNHLRSSSLCDAIYSAIEDPCRIMSSALERALSLLEDTVAHAFDVPRTFSLTTEGKLDGDALLAAYPKAQNDIAQAVKLLKVQLGTIHSSLERRTRPPLSFNEVDDVSKEVFAISLFTVSLLQLAADLNTALRVGKRIITKLITRKRRRIWFPKLTRSWFTSHTSIISYEVGDFNIEQFSSDVGIEPSAAEQREGVVEEEEELILSQLPNPVTSKNLPPDAQTSKKFWNIMRIFHWKFRLKKLWASYIVPRRTVSRFIHSLKHSRNLQHALKNAAGIALLSLPAFLPDQKGGTWFQHVHGQWAVITYIYVLETNTGATIRTGGLRFVGTVCGALYAFMAYTICQQNPFAIVFMITLAEIPVSWLIIKTSVPPIGVVASITIPPVLFTNLHRTKKYSTEMIAVDRAAAITIGILAAVLVNHFVYPRHCRRIFLDQVSKTLGRFNDLYLSLARSLSRQWVPTRSHTTPDPFTRKNVKLESEIRDTIYRMNAIIDIMHLEISILPKPLKTYRHLIRTLQRAIDIMVGLRRVRDHIPRKETVQDVMPFRREVISCICISLFACEATFRTGSALPQFLPSPQHALDELIREKELHSMNVVASPAGSPGGPYGMRRVLSKEVLLSFALAENALLEEFVATLEEILRVGRRLHGVEEWFEEEDQFSSTDDDTWKGHLPSLRLRPDFDLGATSRSSSIPPTPQEDYFSWRG